MERVWTRSRAAAAVLLMGAGLIGLPSVPDDLAKWPPILAQLGGVLSWVADLASPLSGWVGRWLVFMFGAWLFWRSLHASLTAPVAVPQIRSIASVQPSVNQPTESPSPSAKLTTRRKAGRTYVDTTIESLVGLFEGRLDIQAKRLIQPYIGKWTTVHGPLGDVHADNDDEMVAVTFDRQDDQVVHFPDVYLFFKPSWGNRLAALKKGDSITVVGRITKIDTWRVTLWDCELEAVGVTGADQTSDDLRSVAAPSPARPAQTRTPTKTQAAQAPQRAFVASSVTPENFSRPTAGDIGKWMPIRGPVISVQIFETSAIVHLEANAPPGDRTIDIPMWFRANMVQQVGRLNPGNEIAAVGRITGISDFRYELHDCELVEPTNGQSSSPAISSQDQT